MVKRALFVGMGSIGTRHLTNIKKILPNIQIGTLRFKGHDVPDYVSNLIDFEYYELEDAKNFFPDLVFITNPTSLHVETALHFKGLVSGIFIEKPLSDSIKEAKKLHNNENNTLVHVACPMRFHPIIKFLKNYFRNEKQVLNIRIYYGSHLSEWRPQSDYRTSYSAKKNLGGGVSLDLTHEIDYMIWIFGDVIEGYFGSSKISDLETDVEDIAYGVWKLENGGLCEIHLDYFRKTPKRDMEIVTKDSVIYADFLKSKITLYEENKEVNILDFDFERNDMYIDEMKYFLKCVNKKENSINGVPFAIKTLSYAIKMRNNEGFVKL